MKPACKQRASIVNRSVRRSACRDCGMTFGGDVVRDTYSPGRCVACGRVARRNANRKSYEKHNRHRIGRSRGSMPGSPRHHGISDADVAQAIAELHGERIEGNRQLPQTCEFCEHYECQYGLGMGSCHRTERGESCLWSPRYKTQDDSEMSR